MKDIEILLRAFAMLITGNDYKPSMIRFLNSFSRKSKGNSDEKNSYLAKIFDSFLSATGRLSADAFINKRNNRLNIALVEAVFTAACRDPFLTQG